VSDSGINPLSLKVSAIVWYEEPSMRFAMINGLKATEGSVIEGVKVVEIKPTSVRLFHNEKYFDLFMDR
jgi:predicted nuclease with RNAse H fold